METDHRPLIIGHRGASAVAPENTMVAFRNALDSGADGIEFDVRLSCDGIPVIIHDDTLRRTGLRPEHVEDLTVEELKKVDVGSWFSKTHQLTTGEYAKQIIPTLQELLDHCANNDALLYLELKPARSNIPEIVCATTGMLAGHPARHRVVIECFDFGVLKEVKRVAPDMMTAALFEPGLRHATSLVSQHSPVERAKSVGADEIALHHKLVSNRAIELARNAGLKVVVWTVDDPHWLSRAREFGVDVLITNDPAVLLRHRAEARAV